MKRIVVAATLAFTSLCYAQQPTAPPPSEIPGLPATVPQPPVLVLDDFKAKLGQCQLNEIQMEKQQGYIQTLQAKIVAQQAEIDKLKEKESKVKP